MGTSKNCRCRLMPQNCRRMIPLCSRFDSLAFTFLPVSISSEIDFSRSPRINLNGPHGETWQLDAASRKELGLPPRYLSQAMRPTMSVASAART
jgi:hypothetical protein